MTLKTTLLAAVGALIVAGPAAVQAQPYDSDSYYYQPYYSDGYYYQHRDYREHRGCYFGKRYEYGVFGRYRPRTTLICR